MELPQVSISASFLVKQGSWPSLKRTASLHLFKHWGVGSDELPFWVSALCEKFLVSVNAYHFGGIETICNSMVIFRRFSHVKQLPRSLFGLVVVFHEPCEASRISGSIQDDNPKTWQPSKPYSSWWFQIFFIFTPTWGRFPIWLIFFNWVETTN